MAKPIRATPTLYGKDADNLLRKMIATEKRKITKRELDLAREISIHSKYFEVQQPAAN